MKFPSWLPIVVKLGKEVADMLIDGADLNDELIGSVKVAYYGFHEFRDNIVKDPGNSYSDETIDALLALCEDTAKEGSFPLDKPTPNN